MALLRLTDITKSFGGVRALKSVSFDLAAGEVHALVGENGAGKSTLIKVITGAHRPDAGTIELAGQPLADNDPTIARKLGVAAIYQQPALFADLTVAENIAFRLEAGGKWRIVRWEEGRRRAEALLKRVWAVLAPDALVLVPTMTLNVLVALNGAQHS